MQTNLADFIRDSEPGRRADAILRSCVHCGFCTATCPTYQLLGDELDGPRGRIYLIKQVLEGEPASAITQLHLDRCLTCRSCETTCPSGVRYGQLLDIGRAVVEAKVRRPPAERALRAALRALLVRPRLFGALFGLGRLAAPLLPARLRATLHAPAPAGAWPAPRHARRMLVLRGCVQPTLAPRINAAAARVLDALGISLLEVPASSCCGAIDHHLNAHGDALGHVRRNIDAWCSALDAGAEVIVTTASGCGAMVKDYADLLAHDSRYAAQAARVSAASRDLGEVLAAEDLDRIDWQGLAGQRLAYHAPCTLQHGQQLAGQVEGLLGALGLHLLPVRDAHLCCGSAGTYALLQPELAMQLRERKLANLEAHAPQRILTANIGCLHHLQAAAGRPVQHWIETLDAALPGSV